MTIDADTIFDTVQVLISPGQAWVGANALQRTPLDRSFRAAVPQQYFGYFDPDDPDVQEVVSRVEAGSAEVVYMTEQDGEFAAADLPSIYHWARERHPFHLTSSAQGTLAEGPHVELFYKRLAGMTPPDLPTVMYSATTTRALFRQAMVDAGLTFTIPTGSDPLYWLSVTYGVYEDGTAFTEFSPWKSDSIQYSVDDGENWSTTPPTDPLDLTSVSINGDAGWVDIPVTHDESRQPVRRGLPPGRRSGRSRPTSCWRGLGLPRVACTPSASVCRPAGAGYRGEQGEGLLSTVTVGNGKGKQRPEGHAAQRGRRRRAGRAALSVHLDLRHELRGGRVRGHRLSSCPPTSVRTSRGCCWPSRATR